MRDGILKGAGDSRYLKTVKDALTRYPRYEDFVAALIAGTFPFDLNGVNPAGWAQQGTALNKGTLLKDYTAENLGLTPAEDATPAEVLEALRSVATRDTGNLLINADFRYPIDDRGGYVVLQGTHGYAEPECVTDWGPIGATVTAHPYSSTAYKVTDGGTCYVKAEDVVRGYIGAGAYTINNWKVYAKGTILCVDGGIRLVDVIDWGTQIENYKVPINIPITISVLTETGMGFATRSFSGQADESMYRDLGNGVTINFLRNWANSGTTLIALQAGDAAVKAVKLELGSTQTLAHQDENGNWVLNDPPPNRTFETLKAATSTVDANGTHSGMFVPCAKLVWENASPDNRFLEQTIPIDLSAYDAVMVVTNEGAAPSVVKMGESRWVFGTTGPNTGGVQIWFRRCTVSVDSVYFGRSTHSPQEAYLSDAWCVPLRIYGIKGVSA